MSKTILITGATAGFGEAIAKKFASHHYRLILTGRRKDILESNRKYLISMFGTEVLTLSFDVQKKKEVQQAINGLPEEWKTIDILVNNAGLAAGLDLIQEGSTDDWDDMIDTNVKGLLYVSREIIPLMIVRKEGHIVNMASTASRYVYEKGNVYCASKFAVDAISQGMRIDLLKHNIRVSAIYPGAAKTEFSMMRFKGDEEKASNVYKGFEPLTADDIADAVYYCTTCPPRVCISELMITPTAQANPMYLNRK